MMGSLIQRSRSVLPAVTLTGAVVGGDVSWTDVGDMTFHAGSILASGATNGNTLLLKANDTTFITFTTGATDECELEAVTMKGTWLADGTVTMPALTLAGDVTVGTMDIDDDSGVVDLVDMGVTADPVAGTEQSLGLKIDGTLIAKAYAEADSSGGIQNTAFVIGTGVALKGYNTTVENHIADDTLTLAESGSIHTNYGEDGAMTLTLPASATAGTNFKFVVGYAGGLRVCVGAASEVFINNGTTSTDDGGGDMYLEADDEGETANFVCISAGVWLVDVIGTWAITQP